MLAVFSAFYRVFSSSRAGSISVHGFFYSRIVTGRKGQICYQNLHISCRSHVFSQLWPWSLPSMGLLDNYSKRWWLFNTKMMDLDLCFGNPFSPKTYIRLARSLWSKTRFSIPFGLTSSIKLLFDKFFQMERFSKWIYFIFWTNNGAFMVGWKCRIIQMFLLFGRYQTHNFLELYCYVILNMQV